MQLCNASSCAVATVGKKNTENGGTPSYKAPERIFKGENPDTTEQDKKGDVYSFAQTVADAFGIETAAGRKLLTLNYFDRLRGHDEAHHLGQYSKFLTEIGERNNPPGIGALIKSGLAYNPDERPSMTEFRRRLEAMNRAAFLEEFGSLKLSRQKRAVEREKKYAQKTVFNGRLFEDRKGAENAAKVSGFAFAPVEDPKTRGLRFGVVLQDGSGPFAMKSDPRNGREFGEELAEILRTNRFLPNHAEGTTLLQQAKKAKHRELQMLLQDLGLKD